MRTCVSLLLIAALGLSACTVKAKGGGSKVQVTPGHVKVQAK